MEYTNFLARLLAAAYGLAAQDIGITEDLNKAVSEVQQDLSESKGYGSILHLLKEVFNQEIIWNDFGFDDLEFDWVSTDNLPYEKAFPAYQIALQSGQYTINEVRAKLGEAPYDDWGDIPAILTPNGFVPISILTPEEQEQKDQEDMQNEQEHELNVKEAGGKEPEGEKPYQKMTKAMYTLDGFKTWMDDRGYSQPFIFMNIQTGKGWVVKPPVAVNLMSTNGLEEELTADLHNRGLNVFPVKKMTYLDIITFLSQFGMVGMEFDKYINIAPEYDSEKWKGKFGHSRKFDYYLMTEYVDGFTLDDPLLLKDMDRDPVGYTQAITDLAKIKNVENELMLGDRRANQYIITRDKRAFGFDYQFAGDEGRWLDTKDAIHDVLTPIPTLQKLFDEKVETVTKSISSRIKERLSRYL